MSESEDGGPGRREVAHRIFAAEFDDSEFSYSESDEERAPNYVVTPTGARVNRLFAVGVLTELEQVNEEVLRARIVDPTGPFVVYAGQYQPEALAFLEAAQPPLFVAVTGKARTFEPEDSDRVFTSIRPESVSEVDAETRDRWVVQAAEQTIERVARTASAKRSGLSGETLRQALADAGVAESDAAGTALALDYYGTTGEYLQAVRDLAMDCARVVAGERDEAGTLSLAPGDGTDAPLSALATIAIEAPEPESEATAASAEPTGESTATPSADAEPTTADTEPTEPDSEPTGVTTETGSTAESADTPTAESSDEGTTEIESETVTSQSTGDDDSAASETLTDEEPSTAESVSPESESPAETTADSGGSSETLGDFDSSDSGADEGSSADDDVGEFDTEFELDDDEREEIEQEYGTDFQSGTEVDDAGEADIDTPDPEELAEMEAEAADDDAGTVDTATSEPDTTTEPVDDTAPADDDPADAEDVDLEDAVMAAMEELNDGSGADREAVVDEVVEQYGADREAVADAIQDALMGGRCYEPGDGKLTPI